ncbi:MAG: hypothetical protein WC794_02630 [Candidatus Doudnabacteria bacterium]|jgi:prephenate dehydrogenase
MTIAVIGARGDMAKNFLVPFLGKIGKVIKIDKHSNKAIWCRAWSSDVIWLSVPREEVPAILHNLKLKPSQLIVDICSMKKNISDLVLNSGATHLSLHPLQGPFVPLKFQKWVVIKTRQGPTAKKIISLLKDQGVSLINVKSESEHDFMMGAVLAMPEFLTVIIHLLLKNFATHNKRKNLRLKELLDWATPAFNVLIHFYLHSINSTPGWLRKEFVLQKKMHFWVTAKKTLNAISAMNFVDISRVLNSQKLNLSRQLTSSEQISIRRSVNKWYTEMN